MERNLSWNKPETHTKEGDLAELVGLNHKHSIIKLKAGADFQTHRGVIQHDDMIGIPWGSQIFSHMHSPFFILQPSLSDLIRGIKRNTQILYPKDIGYIILRMGIGPGQHVLEAGTGSGGLTTALAYMVGDEGHVTTYEIREEMQKLAKSNLERVEMADRVTFKLGDMGNGFEETGVDAVFLDAANSYDYIGQVKKALKPGGHFGAILPTFNQVEKLLIALRQEKFAFIDVCEILLRFYKPEPQRLRPTDRMVAHTGFLIFGRSIYINETEETEAEFLDNFSEEE
jgi:tRNA (adenine57-N1/adenine58-N1)-methyltransferase